MNYINTKDFHNYTLKTLDGEMGSIVDFYSNNKLTKIRFIVVNIGSIFKKNLVLLTNESIYKINHQDKQIHLYITSDELLHSPSLKYLDEISKLVNSEYYSHQFTVPLSISFRQYTDLKTTLFNNLLSGNEISRYSINTLDGSLVKIDGFLINRFNFKIDFIRFKMSGKSEILRTGVIRPEWITEISTHLGALRVPHSKMDLSKISKKLGFKITPQEIQRNDKQFLNLHENSSNYQRNKMLFTRHNI